MITFIIYLVSSLLVQYFDIFLFSAYFLIYSYSIYIYSRLKMKRTPSIFDINVQLITAKRLTTHKTNLYIYIYIPSCIVLESNKWHMIQRDICLEQIHLIVSILQLFIETSFSISTI